VSAFLYGNDGCVDTEGRAAKERGMDLILYIK
jgi:hypothetical protein